MTERKKITITTLFNKAAKREPISWLTCYDYPTAYFQEQAGIDMILVGDSLGMTMLGYDTTLPVTMDDMIRHTQAVRRGAPTAFIVGVIVLGVVGFIGAAITSGFAIVYLAEQERPSRRVALKLMKPGLASAQALRRFGQAGGSRRLPAGTRRVQLIDPGPDRIHGLRESGQPGPVVTDARQHPVEELPDDALTFLLASRLRSWLSRICFVDCRRSI